MFVGKQFLIGLEPFNIATQMQWNGKLLVQI